MMNFYMNAGATEQRVSIEMSFFLASLHYFRYRIGPSFTSVHVWAMRSCPGLPFYTLCPPIVLKSYTVLVPATPGLSGKGSHFPLSFRTFLYGGPDFPLRSGPSAIRENKNEYFNEKPF
jgi:hypothetical protein